MIVVVAVAAEVVVAATAVAADAIPDFPSLATAIGKAWANELVSALHLEERDVVGPWPGTLGEARMRVLHALRVKLDTSELEKLARIANIAARNGWSGVAGRDTEL